MDTSLETRPPRPRLTSQVVLGLLVIAVGVLFTLDNLEVLDARDYLRYWPAGLVAVGGLKLWQAARDGQGWFSGVFFTVLGVWMLVNRIVYIRLDARDVWPLLLLGLGGFMVWRGFGVRRRGQPLDGRARLSALAIMGGVARRSNAPDFAGGEIMAIMGGCEIDLRQASIAPGNDAVIDVFAFWGGIQIRVPEDWTVVTSAIPLMGGVEDKSRPLQPASGKRLDVRGLVLMGGVEIKN
jgi:cell wall-active antibiotic response 4TMS protein YvqF